MSIDLSPELAAQVHAIAEKSGRTPEELVEESLSGYFAELEEARRLLDRRYEERASGRVKPIPGEEAIKWLEERAAARRKAIA
jgi:predicted transcriptional regulator